MAVSYDKLLHLLIDRQMSNAELIKGWFLRKRDDTNQTQEIHFTRQH